MSASDLEGYSLRLADKHGQPRSLLAASLEKASSILASSPSGRIRTRYSQELLLELRSKKECNICPSDVPPLLNKNTPSSGVIAREDEGILIQRGPRNTPGKGADGEGRSPQEIGPASWHSDREAWRPVGRPRSFEEERGPPRGGVERERERWDKELGPGGPRGTGPRTHPENHRPMNPPGFGGARWGENRAGPGGRFRPEDREGPGRFRDEGGRGSGPVGPNRPLWDHPPGRERGPQGAGPARMGSGFDRRGPSDDKRGPPGRPSGGNIWDEEYKDDETFGFDDPKQQSGTDKEEEEKKRRAQFEMEFEEMRKARHKKPEASENNTPSKKHDEDGVWDTNLSFEQSATTTTVTAGGQVNRRVVTTTMTGLRAPPGFGGGVGMRKADEAGPVTPRTPRASDGDWRINKRTLIEETVEPSKGVTPSKTEREVGVQKGESKSEGGGTKAPGGPSLLDTLFAAGEKSGVDGKDEGGAAKTKESSVLNNLFKNAHRKVFPGLGDDDPVTEAVLSDRWADAVEAEEADAKASKFARWFNKDDDAAPEAAPPSVAAETQERSLASSALMSLLQKPGATANKNEDTPPSQSSGRNPLDLLFPSAVGSTSVKAMPAGPSLAEIELAMQSEAGGNKEGAGRSDSPPEKETVEGLAKGKPEAPTVKARAVVAAEPRGLKSPHLKAKALKSGESGGVAVKGLRDLVAQEKQNSKSEKKERNGVQKGAVDEVVGSLHGKHEKEKDTSSEDQGASQEKDGKALFTGGQKLGAPAGGDMLASIFGTGPQTKPGGAPAKTAAAPVFLTLEDIEKSMLEDAGKSSGRTAAKSAAVQAAPKPTGKADVIASMHLLSLLKKGPPSETPEARSEETSHAMAVPSGAPGVSETHAKIGSTGPLLEEQGAWTFPEMHGSFAEEALAFKNPGHGDDGMMVERRAGLGKAEETRSESLGPREPDVLTVVRDGDAVEPGLLSELLMRRHLADQDGSGLHFLNHDTHSEAAPNQRNNNRLPALGGPEGAGWAGGPPDSFYAAQRGQQQVPPPQLLPSQVLHQHPHHHLPPHLAGLWPYQANGGPFGPGPPSGPFYGAERGPYGSDERQGQLLERQSSGSSNGALPGGPFGQPPEHSGTMPTLPPPYAFNLRGLMPQAGPQGMPPQFAHVNGPLPGGYMRPLFNLPYAPDGLHAGGPPQSMFGPASSQTGRLNEHQMAHRPPPPQFLGGSPYGADFWGGTQPGGLGSGEGLPSAAR